ncbi:protein phosphatase 2C domain-containing protein, partial [Paraburkholderia hospita]
CEPNQDAMGLAGWRGGWIASVADGLGSRQRSETGARRACQVTRQTLRDAPAGCDLSRALPSIHAQWLAAIAPVRARDAATTLLVACVSAQGEVQVAQLGDGLVLMRCGGVFRRVSPERDGFGNQTWALDSVHCPDRWSLAGGRFSQPGDGVVLLTDGVGDDLEPDCLPEFVDTLYRNLALRNRRRGRRWIGTELQDWATPMHGDDKTLVAIFRTF